MLTPVATCLVPGHAFSEPGKERLVVVVLNQSSDQCGCERSHRIHVFGYSHKPPENRAGTIKRWELLYLAIQLLSNEIKGLVIFQGGLLNPLSRHAHINRLRFTRPKHNCTASNYSVRPDL
jgi:hypothetical protein